MINFPHQGWLSFRGTVSTVTGFILFDGSNTGSIAFFQRRGLEKWWVWGADLDYQFKLNTDGDGAYYNFSGVEEGEKVKPNELFSCRKSP